MPRHEGGSPSDGLFLLEKVKKLKLKKTENEVILEGFNH
jgi:hypothetical protein